MLELALDPLRKQERVGAVPDATLPGSIEAADPQEHRPQAGIRAVVAPHLGGGERTIEVPVRELEEGRQPAVEPLLEEVPAEVEVDLSQVAIGLDDPGD